MLYTSMSHRNFCGVSMSTCPTIYVSCVFFFPCLSFVCFPVHLFYPIQLFFLLYLRKITYTQKADRLNFRDIYLVSQKQKLEVENIKGVEVEQGCHFPIFVWNAALFLGLDGQLAQHLLLLQGTPVCSNHMVANQRL